MDPARVQALGVSGQQHGLVALDAGAWCVCGWVGEGAGREGAPPRSITAQFTTASPPRLFFSLNAFSLNHDYSPQRAACCAPPSCGATWSLQMRRGSCRLRLAPRWCPPSQVGGWVGGWGEVERGWWGRHLGGASQGSGPPAAVPPSTHSPSRPPCALPSHQAAVAQAPRAPPLCAPGHGAAAPRLHQLVAHWAAGDGGKRVCACVGAWLGGRKVCGCWAACTGWWGGERWARCLTLAVLRPHATHPPTPRPPRPRMPVAPGCSTPWRVHGMWIG